MLRQSAPYGIRPDTRGLAPVGAPPPPAGVSAPFPITSGPDAQGGLSLPFAVDGFYHSAAVPGWPSNGTVTHHYITLPDAESPVSADYHKRRGGASPPPAPNGGSAPKPPRLHERS
jgi:hypothetical protein